MFRNVGLSMLGLLVAAGGPVAYFKVNDYMNGRTPAAAIAAPEAAGAASAAAKPSADGAIDSNPVVSLDEALDFGITPQWVLARWPRISAGLGQVQLQGYRVPLVTGTREDDLVGSITYYFNPHQMLQRITFYGNTGNADRLVQTLATRYGFARKVLNQPGIYVYEVPDRDGRVISTLRLETAAVIKQSDVPSRFKLSLVLERPMS